VCSAAQTGVWHSIWPHCGNRGNPRNYGYIQTFLRRVLVHAWTNRDARDSALRQWFALKFASVSIKCAHMVGEASKPRSLEDVEVDNPAHFHQLLQSLPTQVRGGEYVLGICFVLHGDKQYIRRHSTTFLHGFEIVFHQLKFQWVYHFLEDWTSKTLLVHSTNSQRQCCPPSGPEDIEKDPTPPCGISCISCPFGTKLLKFAQGMYCLWNHCAAKGRNCEALRLFVLSWFVSAWNHFELQPTCKDMKGLSALATEQAVAMLPDTKRCSSNSF